MIESLDDAVIVLEDAIKIRRKDRANLDPETDYDTEESVIAALLENGASPIEVLQLKDRYTRAVRLILRQDIDPKG